MSALCGIIPSKHLLELGFGGATSTDMNHPGNLNPGWLIHAQGGPTSVREDVLDDMKTDFAPSSVLRSDEFRMYGYKILPCPKAYRHDWAVCPFAHNGERARRRDPRVFNYVDILCPNTRKKKACPRGDSCPFAHNIYEYWLHPNRYRTELCRDGHACNRDLCFFAHSDNELRRAMPNTSRTVSSVLGLDSATAALLEGEDSCDLDNSEFGAAAALAFTGQGAGDSQASSGCDRAAHLQVNHSAHSSSNDTHSSSTPQKIVEELKNMVSMVESNAGQFSPAILDWLENAVARLRSHQRLSQAASQEVPVPGSPGLSANEPEPRAMRTSSSSSRGSHEASPAISRPAGDGSTGSMSMPNPTSHKQRSPTVPAGSPLVEGSSTSRSPVDVNAMWVLGRNMDMGSPALQSGLADSPAVRPTSVVHSPLEAGLTHLQESSMLWPHSPQLVSQRGSHQEQVSAGMVHRSSSAPAGAMDPMIAQLLATLSLARPNGQTSGPSNTGYAGMDSRSVMSNQESANRALLMSQADRSPVLGVPSVMSSGYPSGSPLPLLSSLSSQGASPQIPFAWDGAASQMAAVSTGAQFNELYNRLINSGWAGAQSPSISNAL